ncbi:MAG TPA: thiamine diphosphokinase [Coriobacteriia bacterium]
MREVLVVGAAPAPHADAFYRSLLASARTVVAADAAGEWCVKLGRVPDVVVGDFDSADLRAADRLERLGIRVERHPVDKDETDLELAVAVAKERWDLPVCITAAFTARLDHTLAALGLVLRAGDGAHIVEPSWRAWPCVPGRPLQLQLACGMTYSLLALERCEGVDAMGGKWGLQNADLEPLSGLGVSNEAAGAELQISVRSGSLLVIANDAEV